MNMEQRVVVKAKEGYITEGLTGVTTDTDGDWCYVLWDNGSNIDGWYPTKSFDIVETSHSTNVFNNLLIEVEKEAFERGKEEGYNEASTAIESALDALDEARYLLADLLGIKY